MIRMLNAAALGKVRDDKIREATDGHDGTWVAHPGLVPIAREEFDKAMPAPNQIDKLRGDVIVTAADLLKLPGGTITEEGLRTNISVGVQYMAAWLSGNGCVPLYNLMEDAATAEISRTQVWQWVHHPKGILADGRNVTLDTFPRGHGRRDGQDKNLGRQRTFDQRPIRAGGHNCSMTSLPAIRWKSS